MIVSSTDGVHVAVHDLAGRDRDQPAMLISHATGFHAFCYLPLAQSLARRFHSIGFDYRGHGDTPQPPHTAVSWASYAEDLEAVALSLTRPLAAFGHSMGGACLLMVAHRHPELFSHLVIYEPVVFPPVESDVTQGPVHLAEGARRRRATFASYDAAIANFSAKPPLGAFTPAAVEAYVRHGFRQGADGQVHLKCEPELEATTFEMSRSQHTWDLLPEIATPVLVMCGLPSPDSPAQHSRAVSEQLADGTYLQLDDLDHFGPMTDPDRVADLISSAV